MEIKKSFDEAIHHLNCASHDIMLAYYDIAKYQHPAAKDVGKLYQHTIKQAEELTKLRDKL